jgi:sensor histidine kinase YesM
MFSRAEKKLVWYTSLFIAVVFNASRLMALRPGAFVAQYWHFNGFELLCQAAMNLMVCVAAVFVDIHLVQRPGGKIYQAALMALANILLLAAGIWLGVFVQVRLFGDQTPITVFRGAYFLRLLASQVLMGILAKIILILRESNAKERENEKLRNAYLKAQLELLKKELNPHFLFNTLSSLSAIVRENPAQAQQYIAHLSKIFRYTLYGHDKNMVTVKEELATLEPYIALQKMRLEDGFAVRITVQPQHYKKLLPFMSLQPLLENALKHNRAAAESPLKVDIFVNGDGVLAMQNNIQPMHSADHGAGIGLANLNERYRILMHKEITIEKTDAVFAVKLPLQEP